MAVSLDFLKKKEFNTCPPGNHLERKYLSSGSMVSMCLSANWVYSLKHFFFWNDSLVSTWWSTRVCHALDTCLALYKDTAPKLSRMLFMI